MYCISCLVPVTARYGWAFGADGPKTFPALPWRSKPDSSQFQIWPGLFDNPFYTINFSYSVNHWSTSSAEILLRFLSRGWAFLNQTWGFPFIILRNHFRPGLFSLKRVSLLSLSKNIFTASRNWATVRSKPRLAVPINQVLRLCYEGEWAASHSFLFVHRTYLARHFGAHPNC